MVRTKIPNKDGDYEVDGISIIVLPDTIIIDTGRRTDTSRFHRDDRRDTERATRRTGRREPKEKSGGLVNTIMENARDLATGKKKWDERLR